MADRRRSDARIDADEQDPDVSGNPVLQSRRFLLLLPNVLSLRRPTLRDASRSAARTPRRLPLLAPLADASAPASAWPQALGGIMHAMSDARVPPIRVEHVSKRFDKTVALDDVSLEVGQGEIFGLLGPNGAGKTTLIRTILDIIKPDTGRVELFGRPFQPEHRDRIGYLPEERGLYTRQPVNAVLEYLGTLKGLSPSDARAQAEARGSSGSTCPTPPR